MENKTCLNRLVLYTGTLGPAGLMPFAPGTWGAAVAACLAGFAPWCFLGYGVETRLGIVLVLFVAGAVITGRAAQTLSSKDPGCIVFDELVGQWVTYLPFATLSGAELFAGFLLFRVFDIIKPFPIRQAEHWFSHGWGIMIDDVIAGIYAALMLAGLRFVL